VSLSWFVGRTAFRRHATYRIAALAAVLENSVVSMLRGFVYVAVVHARGEIGGLRPAEAVTFAFVAGAIEAGFLINAETEISGRIRTGDVITDLYRPVDFQRWWLANEAGRAAFMFLARGVPPFLFGLVVFDLELPPTIGSLALFGVSVLLSFLVLFAWKFNVALTGFWLLDTRGVTSLSAMLITLLSGALLPLPLLPDWFADVARWLPPASIIQTPFDLFVGRRAALPALAVQAAWTVALLVLGRVVLRRAVARVVVQGG
jgi:ABC-2 type transport system permease protein